VIAVNQSWSAYTSYVYDLVRAETRIARVGALYRDECFAILLSVDDIPQSDRDISKGVSFLVRFGLKYLGEFGE
jgi:hypothetical protein